MESLNICLSLLENSFITETVSVVSANILFFTRIHISDRYEMTENTVQTFIRFIRVPLETLLCLKEWPRIFWAEPTQCSTFYKLRSSCATLKFSAFDFWQIVCSLQTSMTVECWYNDTRHIGRYLWKVLSLPINYESAFRSKGCIATKNELIIGDELPFD